MTSEKPTVITSLQNPRVKEVVKLRRRPHRDEAGLLIIEGYREVKRALENRRKLQSLFFCPALFQGTNEGALIEQCRDAGTELFKCGEPVFRKIAYRDRPEGLLALARQQHAQLSDLDLPDKPLLLVTETIEKPGNLGTMLRSADATGVDAVIVCDRSTDINNPNVVRASIGTLFALPVVEATSEETIAWLQQQDIRIVAASPDADIPYNNINMAAGTAIVVGSEQYGLGEMWLERADDKVFIPMLGQCDSLNVAAAATILLYEAVRQRQERTSE